MRAGGCSMQQTLTADAASIVKQAVALAKRRGHAQVTPLHVANTMLAASTGLLRTACLQSHSHPLQCKALELCFNVALNRLPASSGSPMLGPHHSQQPSISNALVAAFKRAQAHQRRGSIENQQQPLLAVKIELEQLIISILDDPSVSRVMREAGFSSTQVKSNVEKAVSLELCSQNSASSNKSKDQNNLQALSPSPSTSQVGGKISSKPSASEPVRNEDVNSVIENLMHKRKKNLVIVGESIPNIESVVRGMMDRVDEGKVPENVKEVKFISIPLHSFFNLQREEVEQKMGELTCLVQSHVKGVVLYLGDLKWIADYRVSFGGQERNFYCPVEHMIMEIGRLGCGIGEIGRVWLMGIATFQTYMKCRTGHHSLENLWGLHPVTIPANSLGLSLFPDRNKQIDDGSSQLQVSTEEEKLNCCAECSSKFETEAQNLQHNNMNTESTLSSLPPWLKSEGQRLQNNDQNRVSLRELCKKWNSICSSAHKKLQSLERTLTFPSASPSSISCFSYDQSNPNFRESNFSFREPTHPWRDHEHWPFTPLSSNPNSTPNSGSSSDVMEMEYVQKFKEFNAENLNILCNALEEKVPGQKEIIPEIVGTILQCRSGMMKRKDKLRSSHTKEETWMFFLGLNAQDKETVAREVAKVVFGSYSNFISIGLSSFSSSTRVDSTEDLRNKRTRDEQSCSYIDRFTQAVSANPHRVFLMEDLDQADYFSQLGIKRAIERGQIPNESGEELSLCDAIIIFSGESFKSRSRACSPSSTQKSDGSQEEKEKETSPSVSLDLNISFDDQKVENQFTNDLGIHENVDKCVVFKIQEL